MSSVSLVLVRAGHDAALLALFGALVFAAAIAPLPPRLIRLAWAAAIATLGLFLLVQTNEIYSAAGTGSVLSTLWPVASDTRFGRLLLLRLALLLPIPLLVGRAPASGAAPIGVTLAGIALALQPWFSHAGATGDVWLPVAAALHLLAAGAWLGGLPPLLLVLYAVSVARAGVLVRRFGALAAGAVAVLAASSVWQGLVLGGGVAGLVGTEYGLVALTKLAVLCALLALAAWNRFFLTPALVVGIDARGKLIRSVAAETVLGLAVVGLAACLAMLMPGAHQQPLWPFPWRLSLVALEEPELRDGILRVLLLACPALGGLALLGLAWRRVRWPAWAAGVAVIALALPHLDLLVVPATPTVFYRSPTGFSAAAIARGAALYPDHCAACHGAGGKGDGPAGAGLPIRPADLTAPHLREHTDGEMFSWLTEGVFTPDGRRAMPGFGEELTEDDRWALIDFLRARNAGAALAENQWPLPVPAPALEAICPNDQTREMAGLRGQVVRVLAGAWQSAVTAPPGVTDLVLSPPGAHEPPVGAACTATDPAAWAAYAVLSGVSAADLAGTQILVDSSGWLRARWRPDDESGRSTPEMLAEAVRRIRATPIAEPPGENHVHAH